MSPKTQSLITKAIVYAAEKLDGLTSETKKEPAIFRSLEVMNLLKEMEAPEEYLAAGVLYGILGRTDAELEELVRIFGPDVAYIADAYSRKDPDRCKNTMIANAQYGTPEDRKMVLASVTAELRGMYDAVLREGDAAFDRQKNVKDECGVYYGTVLEYLEDMEMDEVTRDIYGEDIEMFNEIFLVYYYSPSEDAVYVENEVHGLIRSSDHEEGWEETDRLPEDAQKITPDDFYAFLMKQDMYPEEEEEDDDRYGPVLKA